MRLRGRWMLAAMVAAGLLLAGGAIAQKLPDPAAGKGGAAPQSQKLHLTPPSIAPQGRAPQPLPQPPQQQARPMPGPPGAGPPTSQKLHLTPPSIAPQPRGPGARPPQERAAQARPPAPAWPPLPPRMAEEPPALAVLRGLLTDAIALGYRDARQEGEVLTLLGAELRRGAERLLIGELVVDSLDRHGLRQATARDVRIEAADGTLTLAQAEVWDLGSQGLRQGTARDIRIEAPEGSLTLAQARIRGLVLLPLRPGQDGATREPDQMMLDVLSFDGLAVEAAEMRMSLGTFILAGWQLGQPGRMALEGLDLRLAGQPVDEVRLARAGIVGLDIAALLAAAARDELPAVPPAGRQAYGLQGLELRRAGQSLAGVGRLVVEGETRADGFAGGRITLNEVVLERSEETAVMLDMVGLSRLSMDLTLDASWSPAEGRLELSALALGVRELGALALGWTLEGVTAEAAAMDPSAVRLLEARLRYADQSLYARILADQARQQNTTPARVRAEHREMLAAALTGPRPEPALDGLREALLRFVGEQAREVEIVARPAAPVDLLALQAALEQGPGPLAALLGLRAQAR